MRGVDRPSALKARPPIVYVLSVGVLRIFFRVMFVSR